MTQVEGPRQGTAVSLVVTAVFGLTGLLLLAAAWFLAGQGRSMATGVGAVFAFGWIMSTIAGVISLVLRTGQMRAARIATKAGPAAEVDSDARGYSAFVGERARVRGDVYFETRSRAPAIFMACSAALLLIGELLLLGDRLTTPLGAGFGGLAAFILAGGARSLWPRPDLALPDAQGSKNHASDPPR